VGSRLPGEPKDLQCFAQLAEAEADSRRTIRASPGSKRKQGDYRRHQGQRLVTLPTLNNKIANNTTSGRGARAPHKQSKEQGARKVLLPERLGWP
jgi:hypothetical protein